MRTQVTRTRLHTGALRNFHLKGKIGEGQEHHCCWLPPQMAAVPRLGQPGAGASLGLPCVCRGPGTWPTFCCSPRPTAGSQTSKWSSWGLNWCPYGRPCWDHRQRRSLLHHLGHTTDSCTHTCTQHSVHPTHRGVPCPHTAPEPATQVPVPRGDPGATLPHRRPEV